MKRIALYPGTFDPLTNGHFDLIQRSLDMFDELIIAVAQSQSKKPMFSLEQRINMVELATQGLKNIQVVSFKSLTVSLAKEHNATVLIRGLRSTSDFEYELQLEHLNTSLDDSIQTIYLMPKVQHSFVSSSAVRTLINFSAKTQHLVPQEIEKIIGSMK